MKFLAVLAILAFSFGARAETYSCQLIHIVENEADQFQEDFTMDDSSTEAHGGTEKVFTKNGYRVVVIADSKWMGMTWFKDEKMIASVVTVVASINKDRVLMAMDPANIETTQLSLNCTLQPGRFL